MPEIVSKVSEFRDKLYELYRDIKNRKVNLQRLCHQIWDLRKEFESIVPEFDTSKCESFVCTITSNPDAGLGDLVKSCWEKVHKEMPDAPSHEKFKAVWECMRHGIPEKHIESMGELVKHCWEKIHEKMPDAPSHEKFKAVWECIREGDPVSRELLEKMKAVGWNIKPAPMCVIAKEVQGKTRAQAEKECIEEGKLHPINVIAFKAKYGE